MATIYTYKETRINDKGMWIKSADGGPEIYLEPGQARQLVESIAAQGFLRQSGITQRSAVTTQRSAPRPAAPTRKAATTTQRAATSTRSVAPTRKAAPIIERKSTNLVGELQFVGKSSFTNAQMEDLAKSIAKARATKKLTDEMKSLAYEGNTWNIPQISEKYIINGNAVTYVVHALFA